jgi:transposase
LANQKGGEKLETIGIGIDISKKKADICIRSESKTLESFTVSNDSVGIKQLQQRLEPYKNRSRVTMESTGNLWLVMYDALERQGLNMSLANPLKTRAIAEAKIKHDKLDAAILADLAGADLIAKCYVPDKNTRMVRDLIRHRIDLVQKRTYHKNKTHSILDKYCIRYDGVLFSERGMQWLKSQQLDSVDTHLIDSHLQQIELADKLIQQAEKEIAKTAVHDKRVDLLLGFCGIDYYGAMLLLCEIGDISRFSNPKKLASWVGLAPSLYQSGNTTYTGSITRHGNSRIRWYLAEAAQTAARYDPKLRPFYERIKKRKGHQKAIVAVSRKMLVSIYWVLTRNELYDGHRDDLQKKKVNKLNRIIRE